MDNHKNQWIKNNVYALCLLWSISPKRVMHIAIKELTGYFEWLFYQIFFMRYVISSIENQTSFKYMLYLMMICCGIFTVLALYNSYIKSYVIPQTDVIINLKLYEKLYLKSRNVELACFEDADFYNKYTMAIDGAAYRVVETVQGMFKIIFGIIAAIIAFYVIISIDLAAGIFVIFPIVGNFGFGKLMNRVYYGRYVGDVKNQRMAKYIDRVIYMNDYAKEIRYSDIHSLLMKKYKASIDGTTAVMDKYGNQGTRYMWLKNVLSFPLVFEGVMLYASFRAIVTRTMGLADLAIIFSTMTTTSWILIGLFNSVSDMLKNGMIINYIKSFLNYTELIPENQDGLEPSKEIKTIEFRNVCFSYKPEKTLISNVSFKLEAGQCIALVGDNGAGKSTLIKLLLRLYDPTSGEIQINGVDIKKYNLKKYRAWFAVAFQDFKVMAMSVEDNIFMGNKGDEKQAEDVLKKADLYEKVSSFKYGLNTQMTKEFDSEGVMLSGGQNQKLIIARTLANQHASLFVFDEPTSALDPLAEYNMYNSIMKEKKEKMLIFITHRLSSVRDADCILLFKDGKVLEQGKHEDLVRQDGRYAEMYRKQSDAYLATGTIPI